MTPHALALWLCAGLLTVAGTQKLLEGEEMEQKSSFCDWKCMKFVQMWPGSFCVGLGANFSCVIPTFVKSWTIHGLWPNNRMDCCTCWHLFQSDLQDLPSELSQNWPTFTNKTDFLFWKNEWLKHGTCAGCIESLSSPSKYFSMALKLHAAYSIDAAFQRASILPTCNTSYQYETLHSALLPVLGEAHEFQCLTDSQDRQVLMQVKVSLFRNFSSGCGDEEEVGNSSPYRPCERTKKVFFFPIRQEKPRNPCP